MNYQTKRVEINEANVGYFAARFGANGSIQPFTNNLLDLFFEGRLVKLNEKNFVMMDELAKKMHVPVEEVVNICLASIDWGVNESPKPKMIIDTSDKRVEPKGKKLKNNINKMINY